MKDRLIFAIILGHPDILPVEWDREEGLLRKLGLDVLLSLLFLLGFHVVRYDRKAVPEAGR